MNWIEPYLKDGQIISLESTTYPGTTEEILKPIIEKQAGKLDKIYSLSTPEEKILKLKF